MHFSRPFTSDQPLYELLWFVVGSTVAIPVVHWWSQRRSAKPKGVQTRGVSEALVELYAESRKAERLETLATSIGREVADLTSSLESHAQLLVEASGDPKLSSERAENLWKAARRMRFFIHKLLSFAQAESLQLGATDVTKLLLEFRKELDVHAPDGIKVDVVTASALPLAMAEETSLRNALLFLVQTLLDLEPNASELSLHARTGVDEEETPTGEIKIQVESEEGKTLPPPSPDRLQIDFAAARNLLHAQGATISLDHTPGLNAMVCVCLAATLRSLPASTFGPPIAVDRHGFGGVLVLEADPSIRAIVSGELRATDRNIFACTDGASARSLFTATPERFELLILDRSSRLEPGDQIALDAMRINPDVKVLLMTAGINPPPDFPAVFLPRLRILRKPFGIQELRMTIQDLLGARAETVQEG